MISVVLYGRNDSYGYNLHKRAALSLNCIAEVLTDADDEIIFVDYNTPDDFPTFPEAIADTLTERARMMLRVLRVRPAQHERFRQFSHLAALEPIARNVGIRRSNPDNRWILSTNTDMVFVPRQKASLSDVASNLDDAYYHMPRFEVPETLWESLDRTDPRGGIAKFSKWGRDLHLNEIVYAFDPDVRFDGPGDFQLILRSDMWRMHGFHESMLLGWHVDSNMARRLALLPRPVSDIISSFYCYHCDHTRQVTPAHKSRGAQNDLKVFFENVKAAELPEQAATWGLADETVEEISLTKTATAYLASLEKAIQDPLDEPNSIKYSVETFSRLDYSSDHVLPFLVDTMTSRSRSTAIGWSGTKRSLLERFACVWRSMGFEKPIMVFEGCAALGEDLPEHCTWKPLNEAFQQADVFVFDFGKPDDESSDMWRFEKDPAIRNVMQTFRTVVRLESAHLTSGDGLGRRFIGINTINNAIEGVFNNHINAALTPLATHIRQGFLNQSPDLLSALYAGSAGQKLRNRFVALPDCAGHVFYGPYLDLDAGSYRVALELEGTFTTEQRLSLGLEVFSNSYLLAYREITARDLAGKDVHLDFYLPRELSESLEWPRVEFRLTTPGGVDLTVRGISLERVGEKVTEIDFDCSSMLLAGAAGERIGRAIRSRPEIVGLLAYGPYIWLRSGRYVATFQFNVNEPVHGANIRSYVAYRLGREILGRAKVEADKRGIAECIITFDVGAEAPDRADGLLEFLVWSAGTAGFSLLSVHLKRVGEYLAPQPAQGDSGVLERFSIEDAGRWHNGTVFSLGDVAGCVLRGVFELDAGQYRTHVALRRFENSDLRQEDTGLTIAAVSGNRVLAHHAIDEQEISRGWAAMAFDVPEEPKETPVELYIRTLGAFEIAITQARLEKQLKSAPIVARELDCMKLMHLGRAGKWESSTPAGRRFGIRSIAGVSDALAYGPYISLTPGEYEASFDFIIERGVADSRIDIDVTCDLGRRVIASKSVVPTRRGRLRRLLGQRWGSLSATLPFSVASNGPAGEQYEFRVWSNGRVTFYLVDLRLRLTAGWVR